MPCKRPWFKFYPADYLIDDKVLLLSWAAKGMYTAILSQMWLSGGKGLPDDPEKIARLIGASLEEFLPCWQEFLDGNFFIKKDNFLFQKRMISEWKNAEKVSQTKREAQEKSIKVRQGKAKKEVAYANADAIADAKHVQNICNCKMGASQKSESYKDIKELKDKDYVDSAPKTSSPDECPHAQIVSLFHELLPELPKVHDWTSKRQELLRARWRDKPERQTLDWWRELFLSFRESDFIMGKAPPTQGHKQFILTLPWLVNAENLAKAQDWVERDRVLQESKGRKPKPASKLSPAEQKKQAELEAKYSRIFCESEGESDGDIYFGDTENQDTGAVGAP